MSKRLLIADDGVTTQRVIEMTFAGEDVQVLAVGDGEEAIARVIVKQIVSEVAERLVREEIERIRNARRV